MKKILFFLLSVLTFGVLNAQTIWSGHFNITKIASEQFRVELVLQSDPGLQSTQNIGLCISETVVMTPDTLMLSLDSSRLYQHKPFLPTVEIAHYSGILDLSGMQDSTWVQLKFIHCCRPVPINSFWNENWAWPENPMFVAIGRVLLLPDSIQPPGFSVWMDPLPVWIPSDTFSMIAVPKSDPSMFVWSGFIYQGRPLGGDPCCPISSVGSFSPPTAADSCNGEPTPWRYNSLNSMSTYSNNNQWSVNNMGNLATIQWGPNQLGNVAVGFMLDLYNTGTRPMHTFRVWDRSLDMENNQITPKPIRWEVWDITGRLLYDNDILPPNIIMFNNRVTGDLYLCKTTMSDGTVEWNKIVR